MTVTAIIQRTSEMLMVVNGNGNHQDYTQDNTDDDGGGRWQ